MNGETPDLVGDLARELSRQVMTRREDAIKGAIRDAIAAEWFELMGHGNPDDDRDAIDTLAAAVVRRLAAVSLAIAEADRVPPVLEVIEGEGPNVRIRTVIDPERWAVPDGVNRRPEALPFNQSLIGPVERERTVPELLADYENEVGP